MEDINTILSEKMFTWDTPKTKDSENSIRCRFTKKEYELYIKPKLLFS